MEPADSTMDAVLQALRLTLAGSNRLHAAMASELGLNSTELFALGYLADAPGTTPKQLSELLGITTGSTTGTTDHLQKAGFLAREPHPQDRRSILLNLTPAGRHAVKWVLEKYETALADTYDRHPHASPASIAEFLADLAAALDRAATAQTRPRG